MDNKHFHLRLVQGVIDRMSKNSFLVKGWSVLLITGLFALAAENSNIFFIYIAYFPSVVFWILDGYYLWQERLFRGYYDYVRTQDENAIDFSMDCSKAKNQIVSWIDTIFSVTLLSFHGVIILSIFIVMIILLSISINH